MHVDSLSYSYNQNFKAEPKYIIRNGQKWVSKNEYKLPILKLTKKETQEVAILREVVEDLILGRINIVEYCRNHHIPYDDLHIDYPIQYFQNQIESIKRNRYAIQMAKYLKSHGTGS